LTFLHTGVAAPDTIEDLTGKLFRPEVTVGARGRCYNAVDLNFLAIGRLWHKISVSWAEDHHFQPTLAMSKGEGVCEATGTGLDLSTRSEAAL
jgi:hypothetical protein